MATKLAIYNGALRILGEPKLSGLTEDRLPRRLMDDAWDDGHVRKCLEYGNWRFATRTVMIDASTSVEPDFGHQYAFDIPSDYVRLVRISPDEYFHDVLLSYVVERGYFYASITPIYLSYVSDDDTYGGDLSLWPESFNGYVQAELAADIAASLTEKGGRAARITDARDRALKFARNTDALQDPVRFAPPGSWVRARTRGSDGADYRYRRN